MLFVIYAYVAYHNNYRYFNSKLSQRITQKLVTMQSVLHNMIIIIIVMLVRDLGLLSIFIFSKNNIVNKKL